MGCWFEASEDRYRYRLRGLLLEHSLRHASLERDDPIGLRGDRLDLASPHIAASPRGRHLSSNRRLLADRSGRSFVGLWG